MSIQNDSTVRMKNVQPSFNCLTNYLRHLTFFPDEALSGRRLVGGDSFTFDIRDDIGHTCDQLVHKVLAVCGTCLLYNFETDSN